MFLIKATVWAIVVLQAINAMIADFVHAKESKCRKKH